MGLFSFAEGVPLGLSDLAQRTERAGFTNGRNQFCRVLNWDADVRSHRPPIALLRFVQQNVGSVVVLADKASHLDTVVVLVHRN